MNLFRERLGWALAGAAIMAFFAGAVEYCDREPNEPVQSVKR